MKPETRYLTDDRYADIRKEIEALFLASTRLEDSVEVIKDLTMSLSEHRVKKVTYERRPFATDG